MEDVTRSVNETERQAIVLQGIRDLEESFDSWEKSGVSTAVNATIHPSRQLSLREFCSSQQTLPPKQ